MIQTPTGSKERRYLLGQNKHANFLGNPIYEATKRHLINSSTVNSEMQN